MPFNMMYEFYVCETIYIECIYKIFLENLNIFEYFE